MSGQAPPHTPHRGHLWCLAPCVPHVRACGCGWVGGPGECPPYSASGLHAASGPSPDGLPGPGNHAYEDARAAGHARAPHLTACQAQATTLTRMRALLVMSGKWKRSTRCFFCLLYGVNIAEIVFHFVFK